MSRPHRLRIHVRENWYRDVWLLAISVVAVAFLLAFQSTVNQTHSALCALRGDLENRVSSSQSFLATHPNGIPGIPAATIQTSINGQQRTIQALSVITCPKGSRARAR